MTASLVTRLLRAFVRRGLDHFGERQRREICGILAYALSDEALVSSEAADKLADALELLFKMDARWCRYLADNRIIVLIVASHWASYNAVMDGILLGEDTLIETPLEQTASILVHEATHARLARHVAAKKSNLERIERICLTQELKFLRALAASSTVDIIPHLSKWRARWNQPMASPEWIRSQMAEQARAAGLPRWLRSFLMRISVAGYTSGSTSEDEKRTSE